MKPKVSVILPVYNGGEYLYDAINSVLKQSYSNFELIIIDDGSTDKSLEIIKSFNDDRIVLITRPNKGLIFSLNEGISVSKGKYIARMDADDLCHKDRLLKQVDFLENNRNIAVLGTSIYDINSESELIGIRKPPRTSYLISKLLLWGPFLAHPSVMFNREILGGDLYYNENYKLVEDYELWLRLSKKYKLNNLKDCLLYYRSNENGVSLSNIEKQKLNSAQAFLDSSKGAKASDFHWFLNIQKRNDLPKLIVIKSFFKISRFLISQKSFFINFLYLIRFVIK